MYIKQLIIQGFKSYKDQTVMEPFSPGTNVIVGRNGSGKSNFFAAIRFVLGDAYTQLSREERQALLHEGSGSAVMSAYVEIIFDNSDDRFRTSSKEVSLRRTITLKKDEYAVDKKVSTRAEVMSMLDTAGFSLKNSYYIVPQGRVTALTNMKESDRLKLLKEVAGTESYEARRAESLKIMTDTNNKRGKIDELLDYIKNRMSELEEEKEELRGFQEKDRERRCLEYAHHYQQQQAFGSALEEIEDMRQGGADTTGANQKLFLEGEQAISQMDAKLVELNQSLELLRLDRQQLEDDRREISRAKAKSELNVKNLGDNQSAREKEQRQHETDLAAVRQEIKSTEAQLKSAVPDFTKKKQREEKVKQSLDAAKAGKQRLQDKQSRAGRFKSRAERDAWIDGELEDVGMNLSELKANALSADEEVREAEKMIKTMEAELAKLRETREGYGGKRAAIEADLSKIRDTLSKLDDERKLLRREDDKLDKQIANAKQDTDRAQRTLSHAMDRATARGLETIRRMKQQKDIPGAYGTLAELMEVNDVYKLAAEQVAGASLFHYVVDNQETGTMLVNELHKQSGGRVTFMPLAQLRPRPVNMPRSADVVALVDKIEYDRKFDRAFQQVFGRTVVCPNLAIASQYARSHNVDGITPDGDMTNKRNAMTGGFLDPENSRLDAVRAVNSCGDHYRELVDQNNDIRKQIDQKEQEFTAAKGEERKLEQKLRNLDQSFEPLRNEMYSKSQQLDRERGNVEAAIKRSESIQASMNEAGAHEESMQAEKASDFKKALTAAEEQQLRDYTDQVKELQQHYNDARSRRGDAEKKKQLLEAELYGSLRMREDELSNRAFEAVSSTSGSGNYGDAVKELKKHQKRLDDIIKQVTAIDEQIAQNEAKINKVTTRRGEKEQMQQELARAVERQKKKMEKSLQKKSILTQQMAESTKSIRDLGVLPEEAFEKYKRMDAGKITKRLKSVNEALKKFKHVNKKAFEQYNNFMTQQEQLLKRRKELDESQSSIEDLIAHLDQVKDESIERTFKQISKEFATIFERLVPAGHGRLIIQRKSDRRGQEEDDEAQRRSVENYTGVGISVSFNSKEMDEQQKVQQLSGGQKSLCALCLIFAIQQTDPSPMVVFDEVDANLDAQYRTAVASLLDSISKDAGTQFICTTFRPEIVQVADKCYGVTFTAKTSSIDCVPTEAALNFVEGQKP